MQLTLVLSSLSTQRVIPPSLLSLIPGFQDSHETLFSIVFLPRSVRQQVIFFFVLIAHLIPFKAMKYEF